MRDTGVSEGDSSHLQPLSKSLPRSASPSSTSPPPPPSSPANSQNQIRAMMTTQIEPAMMHCESLTASSTPPCQTLFTTREHTASPRFAKTLHHQQQQLSPLIMEDSTSAGCAVSSGDARASPNNASSKASNNPADLAYPPPKHKQSSTTTTTATAATSAEGEGGCGESTQLRPSRIDTLATESDMVCYQTSTGCSALPSNRDILATCDVPLSANTPSNISPAEEPRLFITKLPFEVTAEDLRIYFSQYGRVSDAYVPRNPFKTYMNKGFGFVSFTTPQSIERVLAQPYHVIRNRQVVLDRATQRKAGEDGIGVGASGRGMMTLGDLPPTGGGFDSNGGSSEWEGPEPHHFPSPCLTGAGGERKWQGTSRSREVIDETHALPSQGSGCPMVTSNCAEVYRSIDTYSSCLPHKPHHHQQPRHHQRHHQHHQRHTPVQRPRDTTGRRAKLFIGRLSYDTTAEILRSYFEQFGEVTDAYVPKEPTTGKSRGFGFLTFADTNSIARVLSEAPHEVQGRQVAIDQADPVIRSYAPSRFEQGDDPVVEDADGHRQIPRPETMREGCQDPRRGRTMGVVRGGQYMTGGSNDGGGLRGDARRGVPEYPLPPPEAGPYRGTSSHYPPRLLARYGQETFLPMTHQQINPMGWQHPSDPVTMGVKQHYPLNMHQHPSAATTQTYAFNRDPQFTTACHSLFPPPPSVDRLTESLFSFPHASHHPGISRPESLHYHHLHQPPQQQQQQEVYVLSHPVAQQKELCVSRHEASTLGTDQKNASPEGEAIGG